MKLFAARLLLLPGIMLLMSACVEESAEVAEQAPAADLVPVNRLQMEDQEMPEPPSPVKGHLVARSFGTRNLDGDWPARAEFCEKPLMLLVRAGGGKGVGILALLSLPTGDKPRAITYAIRRGGPGIPDPPAARIALQVLTDQEFLQFQARDGRIDVTELGDRVSATIAVTLEQVSADTTVKFRAVLDRVPVTPGGSRACAAPGAPDSTGG